MGPRSPLQNKERNNSTLLVRYKLNRLGNPQVNHFDISEMLFGGYARSTPLDKMALYG